ncbi:ESAT-6 like protein EsxL, partial [Mycobacterium tuberculosis XTB13-244]
MTINYQFGDV